jgi:hypothetical protein
MSVFQDRATAAVLVALTYLVANSISREDTVLLKSWNEINGGLDAELRAAAHVAIVAVTPIVLFESHQDAWREFLSAPDKRLTLVIVDKDSEAMQQIVRYRSEQGPDAEKLDHLLSKNPVFMHAISQNRLELHRMKFRPSSIITCVQHRNGTGFIAATPYHDSPERAASARNTLICRSGSEAFALFDAEINWMIPRGAIAPNK